MCYTVVLFEYAFFYNKMGFLEEFGTFENFTYFAWISDDGGNRNFDQKK